MVSNIFNLYLTLTFLRQRGFVLFYCNRTFHMKLERMIRFIPGSQRFKHMKYYTNRRRLKINTQHRGKIPSLMLTRHSEKTTYYV